MAVYHTEQNERKQTKPAAHMNDFLLHNYCKNDTPHHLQLFLSPFHLYVLYVMKHQMQGVVVQSE